MRKIISIILILLFFVWILPLGEFIKPEQEKEICAGQRAVCLCTHLIAKQKAKTDGIKFVQSASNGNTQKNNTSPASYDLLTKRSKSHSCRQVSIFVSQSNQLYNYLFVKPIEHVPKV